jgi:hypothetical protein
MPEKLKETLQQWRKDDRTRIFTQS